VVGEWRAQYSDYARDPKAGTITVISDTLHLVDPDGNRTSLAGCPAYTPEEARLICTQALWGEPYLFEGEESLVFWENGTYQQMFISDTFSYTGPINRWKLVESATGDPELLLYGGKHFPEGLVQAFSDNNIGLRPQHSDERRLHELDPYSSIVITYPEDGFTVLYPRICKGELSLTQMVFELYGADDFTVKNPVFKQHKN
jgi:hypothetical protein